MKLKSLSLALIFTLFSNTILAYAPEVNFWKQRSLRGSMGLGQSIAGDSGVRLPRRFAPRNDVVISREFGTIRNMAKGSSGKTIIHIQDIHANVEAQENIAHAIQSLIDNDAVDLIALEGAFEPIDLKSFRNFSHQDSVGRVADYLFQENRISGPILTGLKSPKAIPPIVGVDDKTHYDLNGQAVKDSEPLREKLKAENLKLKINLNNQKTKVFNRELLAFDNQVQAYRNKEFTLGEYATLLARHPGEGRDPGDAQSSSRNALVRDPDRPLDSKKQVYTLDPGLRRGEDKFTNFDLFIEAYNLEKNLNFSQVEHERNIIIKILARDPGSQATAPLLTMSQAFKSGQLNHADFYSYLQKLCEKNNVTLNRYPAMQDYLQYVLLSDSIDGEKLQQELAQLEKVIYEQLAKTEVEKELIQVSHQNYLQAKLLDFALTKQEWDEHVSLRGTPVTKQSKIAAFSPLGFTRNDMISFEHFYEQAELRDQKMAQNLQAAIEKYNAKNIVLVTGGFHSEGIKNKLIVPSPESRGAVPTIISFVPKISKVDSLNGSEYISIFAQEKTPLDQLFNGEKLFLALPPAQLGLAAEMTVLDMELNDPRRQLENPAQILAELKRGSVQENITTHDLPGGKAQIVTPEVSIISSRPLDPKFKLTQKNDVVGKFGISRLFRFIQSPFKQKSKKWREKWNKKLGWMGLFVLGAIFIPSQEVSINYALMFLGVFGATISLQVFKNEEGDLIILDRAAGNIRDQIFNSIKFQRGEILQVTLVPGMTVSAKAISPGGGERVIFRDKQATHIFVQKNGDQIRVLKVKDSSPRIIENEMTNYVKSIVSIKKEKWAEDLLRIKKQQPKKTTVELLRDVLSSPRDENAQAKLQIGRFLLHIAKGETDPPASPWVRQVAKALSKIVFPHAMILLMVFSGSWLFSKGDILLPDFLPMLAGLSVGILGMDASHGDGRDPEGNLSDKEILKIFDETIGSLAINTKLIKSLLDLPPREKLRVVRDGGNLRNIAFIKIRGTKRVQILVNGVSIAETALRQAFGIANEDQTPHEAVSETPSLLKEDPLLLLKRAASLLEAGEPYQALDLISSDPHGSDLIEELKSNSGAWLIKEKINEAIRTFNRDHRYLAFKVNDVKKFLEVEEKLQDVILEVGNHYHRTRFMRMLGILYYHWSHIDRSKLFESKKMLTDADHILNELMDQHMAREKRRMPIAYAWGYFKKELTLVRLHRARIEIDEKKYLAAFNVLTNETKTSLDNRVERTDELVKMFYMVVIELHKQFFNEGHIKELRDLLAINWSRRFQPYFNDNSMIQEMKAKIENLEDLSNREIGNTFDEVVRSMGLPQNIENQLLNISSREKKNSYRNNGKLGKLKLSQAPRGASKNWAQDLKSKLEGQLRAAFFEAKNKKNKNQRSGFIDIKLLLLFASMGAVWDGHLWIGFLSGFIILLSMLRTTGSNPGDIEEQLILAEREINAGNPFEAIQLLGVDRFGIRLANNYFRNRSQKAVQLWKRANVDALNVMLGAMQESNRKLNRGESMAAKTILKNHLGKMGDHFRSIVLLQKLGFIQLEDQDYGDALESFMRAWETFQEVEKKYLSYKSFRTSWKKNFILETKQTLASALARVLIYVDRTDEAYEILHDPSTEDGLRPEFKDHDESLAVWSLVTQRRNLEKIDLLQYPELSPAVQYLHQDDLVGLIEFLSEDNYGLKIKDKFKDNPWALMAWDHTHKRLYSWMIRSVERAVRKSNMRLYLEAEKILIDLNKKMGKIYYSLYIKLNLAKIYIKARKFQNKNLVLRIAHKFLAQVDEALDNYGAHSDQYLYYPFEYMETRQKIKEMHGAGRNGLTTWPVMVANLIFPMLTATLVLLIDGYMDKKESTPRDPAVSVIENVDSQPVPLGVGHPVSSENEKKPGKSIRNQLDIRWRERRLIRQAA